MLGLTLDWAVKRVKEDLESLRKKLNDKEEVKPEEMQKILDDYTELVDRINKMKLHNEKYAQAMNEIDDYVDLIHDEVADTCN